MNDDLKTAIVASINYLHTNAKPDVRAVLEEEFEDQDQVELNLNRLNRTLTQLGQDQAVGAVAIGTGVLRDDVNLDLDVANEAIRWLKEQGVLQQCGRGRGKVLILIRSSFTIGEDHFVWTAEEEAAPAEAEAEAAEAAVVVESSSPMQNLISAVEVLNLLAGQITEVVKELQNTDAHLALQAEIRELKTRLEQQAAMSW